MMGIVAITVGHRGTPLQHFIAVTQNQVVTPLWDGGIRYRACHQPWWESP